MGGLRKGSLVKGETKGKFWGEKGREKEGDGEAGCWCIVLWVLVEVRLVLLAMVSENVGVCACVRAYKMKLLACLSVVMISFSERFGVGDVRSIGADSSWKRSYAKIRYQPFRSSATGAREKGGRESE